MGNTINYQTTSVLANIHAAVEQTVEKLGTEEFVQFDKERLQAFIAARLQAAVNAYTV